MWRSRQVDILFITIQIGVIYAAVDALAIPAFWRVRVAIAIGGLAVANYGLFLLWDGRRGT